MKLKTLFFAAIAAVFSFASCEGVGNDLDLGDPSLSLSTLEVPFEVIGGEETITLTATRDWMLEEGADWVTVSPESGKASAEPQTITLTVDNNPDYDREATLVFTIGTTTANIRVTQSGEKGSVEDLVVYKNDFDKEEATKTFGSGNSWPYLDQFEGWKNQTGTGVANVDYEFSGMSARANSTSNSQYSDYAGSGSNNMFFGSNAFLVIKNIALGGSTDFTLTFGTEKYDNDNKDALFDPAKFHVYLSNDGAKWIDLSYTFAGAEVAGRWNVATANFSVPAATENLWLCIKADEASVYRVDDLQISISEGGSEVDFSQGVALDFISGDSGEVTPPDELTVKTIAEVLATEGALASGTAIEGVVISNMALNNLTSKKGMYVQDATGGLQFYLAANHEFAFGDKVKIDLGGVTVGDYNGAVQISGVALAKVHKISSGNTVEAKTVSVADFLANKYEGQYIAIEGVQVASADLSKTFVMGDAHTSINLVTADGKTFVAFSSKYATYGTATVPQGSGVIKGISSISKGEMQIIFTQESDYEGLTGERFGDTGGEEGGEEGGELTVKTIAEVLATEGALASGTAIEGVVISNMALNNLTSKKGMYVQDATGGLQFYLAANHEFAFGDKVKIDLGGVTVGDYNGAVQISGVALDKITKISSGNTVEAKTVSVEDFLANKYEGQYIAIEGVQVASADLSKTFVMGDAHTSINLETADGKTFVAFSSKFATYGTATVPQGSGVIKGISSISKGVMQIIFTQESDYAGLTGERFGDAGGETPEPEVPSGPVKATVKEFLDAPESDTVYELTGTITRIEVPYSSQYNNITYYIADATGETYVYRMSCEGVSDPESLTVGDEITVQGVRSSYNSVPQMAQGGKYISHIDKEAPAPEAGSYVLDFSDVANRTSFSETEQIWEQNGIKLTNNKASSTSNVADYSAPARFYKSTSLKIEKAGMTKIVFYCNSGKNTGPADMQNSITDSNATVTVDGMTVTITFTNAVDVLEITTLAGQIRVDSLTVFAE